MRVMDVGIFRLLRRGRHWLVCWLVAVMLMPVLAGVLPASGQAAIADLDRDLAWSICADGEALPSQEGNHGKKHEAQCILCAAGCPVCAPAMAASPVATVLPKRVPHHALIAAKADAGMLVRVLRDGSPPRGPPIT